MERRGFFGAIVAWVASLWFGSARASSQIEQLVNVVTVVATPEETRQSGRTRVTTTRDGKLRFERFGQFTFNATPQFVSCGTEVPVVAGWTRVSVSVFVNHDAKTLSWRVTDERDATSEEIENSKMGVYAE